MTTIFALLVVQSLVASIGNITAINRSMDIPARKSPDKIVLV
jgi:hypothetical protein